MKKLEDETLVLKSKEGNEEAIEVLFFRYKPLLHKIIRGYFLLGADEEDLMQEAMIGLYKAILSYNPSKETTFRSFAGMCVKRNILSAIKKSNALKHKVLNDSVSFSALGSFEDDEENTIYNSIKQSFLDEKVSEKEDFNEVLQLIEKKLSKLEYEVLNEYLKGYSYQYISEKLGISNKSVDNALSRIKSKLSFLTSA